MISAAIDPGAVISSFIDSDARIMGPVSLYGNPPSWRYGGAFFAAFYHPSRWAGMPPPDMAESAGPGPASIQEGVTN